MGPFPYSVEGQVFRKVGVAKSIPNLEASLVAISLALCDFKSLRFRFAIWTCKVQENHTAFLSRAAKRGFQTGRFPDLDLSS